MEITAAGMDADTVIPTLSPKYAFAPPKTTGQQDTQNNRDWRKLRQNFVCRNIRLELFFIIHLSNPPTYGHYNQYK